MSESQETSGFETNRRAILLKALPIVAFDGWTVRTLAEAAQEAEKQKQDSEVLKSLSDELQAQKLGVPLPQGESPK